MEEEEEINDLIKQRDSVIAEDYIDYFPESWEGMYFKECSKPIKVDYVYFYQAQVALSLVIEISRDPAKIHTRQCLLDVGSRFTTVAAMATMIPTTYVEARPLDQRHSANYPQSGLQYIRGEAQSLPCADGEYDVVTSLHALEHFGLGRYGDTLDYYGDQKGLQEFSRVLKSNGTLILSVPSAPTTHMQFNRQRMYSPEDITSMVVSAGFKVEHEVHIMPFFDRIDTPGSRSTFALSHSREEFAAVKSQNGAMNTAVLLCARKI